MNIFYCMLSSIIVHSCCHLTPDTNTVKWKINKLTNKKHIFVHIVPCCGYIPTCTYASSVHNWPVGPKISLWLTWYCILSADFSVGTRELGSCRGSLCNRQIGQLSNVCELSGELNYRENVKVKSFWVPFLGLVRILVWVLCWLTDCLDE